MQRYEYFFNTPRDLGIFHHNSLKQPFLIITPEYCEILGAYFQILAAYFQIVSPYYLAGSAKIRIFAT